MVNRRILVCWICALVSINGEIDSKPILKQVRPGGTAMLRCTVGELGDKRVMWTGKGDDVLYIGEQKITTESRFTLERPYKKTYNLVIRNVKLGDGGIYQCKAGPDSSVIEEYTLEIEYSPRILPSESSGDHQVGEGINVTLTCKAKGYPPPKFVWHRKNGNQEMQLETGPQLVIPNIRREDSGVYICIAYNGIEPNGTINISVGVEFAPTIIVYDPELSREKGKSASLECTVVGFPKGRYYWTKDGEVVKKDWNHDPKNTQLNSTATVMILEIRQMESPSGFGVYHCEAENKFGKVVGNVTLQEIVTISNKPAAGTGKDGSVQLCSDRSLFFLIVVTMFLTL